MAKLKTPDTSGTVKSTATGSKEFIMSRFQKHFERKPDASEFKKWATIIKRMTMPEEEDLRKYSVSNIATVYDYCVDYGADPYDIEIIAAYGLVAAIIDNQLGLANGILEQIKSRQHKNHMVVLAPSGW